MNSTKYNEPKITVLGIGGAGCNIVNYIFDYEIENIDLIAANTDSQSLLNSRVDKKIYLGHKLLKGLGAGSNTELGKKAAEESIAEIKKFLEGTSLLFLICGLGGGTGTGATPIVARIAREMNILVVSLVTKPFSIEGSFRYANAEKGLEEIKKQTDSLIIYSNDKLLEELGEVPFQKAFDTISENIKRLIEIFADIIISPLNINLDFSDVKKLLKNVKNTFFGFGFAEGDGKAITAAREVINCKFLEASIKGAKRAIIFIVGGTTTSLIDVHQAINFIKQETGTDIDIQFGQKTNKELKEKMLISLIAVEFDESEIQYANLENIKKKSKINKLENEEKDVFSSFHDFELDEINEFNTKNKKKNIFNLDIKEKKENNEFNQDNDQNEEDDDNDIPPFMK